jgi:hypothetical protein
MLFTGDDRDQRAMRLLVRILWLVSAPGIVKPRWRGAFLFTDWRQQSASTTDALHKAGAFVESGRGLVPWAARRSTVLRSGRFAGSV